MTKGKRVLPTICISDMEINNKVTSMDEYILIEREQHDSVGLLHRIDVFYFSRCDIE